MFSTQYAFYSAIIYQEVTDYVQVLGWVAGMQWGAR